MKSLVFATNNSHKIAEVQRQLGDTYDFRSLANIGCTEEIPETSGTLEGNARQKAHHVANNYGQDCFSEDTGLEVYALDLAPGVDTAHYAGPQRDALDNNQKLLAALADRKDRLARFRTIICLVENGKEHLFEGICEGRIATSPNGAEGFGYDPIFIPLEGNELCFAQMSADDKYRISHRGRAIAQLVAHLKSQRDVARPTQ